MCACMSEPDPSQAYVKCVTRLVEVHVILHLILLLMVRTTNGTYFNSDLVDA